MRRLPGNPVLTLGIAGALLLAGSACSSANNTSSANKPIVPSASAAAVVAQPTSSSRGSPSARPATTAAPASAGTASASGPATGKPYIIGLADPVSGATGSYYGSPEAAGMKTYIDYLNKNGGVGGRPVQLQVLDDKGDVATGTSTYQELVSKGVVGVFGYLVSTVAAAVEPLAASAKVPVIAGGVPDALIIPPRPYFFASNLSHVTSGKIQLAFIDQLAKQAKITDPKVALFYVNTSAGAEFQDAIKQEAGKRNWKVVDTQSYKTNDTDFSVQAASIASQKPDYIVAFFDGNAAPGITDALRQRGLKAPIVNDYAGSAESTFKQANDPDFYGPRSFSTPSESSPAVQEMVQRAKQDGQDGQAINEYFTHGYVTAMLAVEALKRCGTECDPVKYRAALESVTSFDTNGLSGPLGFSAGSHGFVTSARMYHWDAAKQQSTPVSDWITAP